MAPPPKKVFVDDITIVPAAYLNAIFGGDDGYATANPVSPYFAGHLHDGGGNIGSAPLIDLTANITGRLILPAPELKSMKLSAVEATALTSSLFWTIPVPSDAYTAAPTPMYLKIFWSGNAAISPSNAAFRVDWVYLQAGQNVMPPSVINLGEGYWPANTISSNNPTPTTFRFKVSASPSQLYVNDGFNTGKLIQLTLPTNAPGANLSNFLFLGLELTSAPTVTLSFPMTQVNVFAVELLYYSSTLGINTAPVLIPNDSGLADF
jgi:hypothetical protein